MDASKHTTVCSICSQTDLAQNVLIAELRNWCTGYLEDRRWYSGNGFWHQDFRDCPITDNGKGQSWPCVLSLLLFHCENNSNNMPYKLSACHPHTVFILSTQQPWNLGKIWMIIYQMKNLKLKEVRSFNIIIVILL